MILQETYDIPNGRRIPKLGLGTWMIGDDKVAQVVVEAAKHMRSNAAVNFTISAEDMETLKNATLISDYGEATMFPVFQVKNRARAGV